MPTTAKQLVKELKGAGFIEVSQSGSHIKLKQISSGTIIIVPYHNGDLKKGLEKAIRKQAGIGGKNV